MWQGHLLARPRALKKSKLQSCTDLDFVQIFSGLIVSRFQFIHG